MDCTKGIMFSFQSSIFTYEDKGFYDKFTTSFSEHQMEGNESSPTDVPSQKESGKLDVKEQEEGHPIGELGPWPALSIQPWAPWHRGPKSQPCDGQRGSIQHAALGPSAQKAPSPSRVTGRGAAGWVRGPQRTDSRSHLEHVHTDKAKQL